MTQTLRRTLAAFVVMFVAVLGMTSPVQAAPVPAQAFALSNCYTTSICAFNTLSPPPLGTVTMPNRDVADAPRNTCFADFNNYPQTFTLINNSAFRWYYFRTTTCGGSHLEIPPYTELHTPAGWDAVRAWYRTSSTS